MNPFVLAFVPGGRISRLGFFLTWFMVAFGCGALLLVVSLGIAGTDGAGPSMSRVMDAGPLILPFVAFAVFVYVYAVSVLLVKRLHDLGHPAYHAVWIIAIGLFGNAMHMTGTSFGQWSHWISWAVAAVVWAVMVFMPGQEGWNRYGEEPV